jgi:hypothetical protein
MKIGLRVYWRYSYSQTGNILQYSTIFYNILQYFILRSLNISENIREYPRISENVLCEVGGVEN